MAVSLKTTLNYHKAEKTKDSLLGLSGCNSLPSNPNKLSSWASKQAAHVINVIYSNFYTRCSGTTLNEYHDMTSVLSDGEQSVQLDILTKSTPNSTECGYKPAISLSCSANGLITIGIYIQSDYFLIFIKCGTRINLKL